MTSKILNEFELMQKRQLMPFWSLILGLCLSILAPVTGYADQTTGQDQEALKKPLLFETRSRIKELGGRLVLDAYTEVTQGLQADKFIDFVSVSTPSTPSSGHARLFSNTSAKQFIAYFSDGSSTVLGSGGGSSGVTNFAAGIGLQTSAGTGNITVALSTPITSSYIPDYISGSSVSVTYLAQSSAALTYLYNSSATATYLPISSATASYLTNSSATLTYLTQSSATASYLTKSSATASYLTTVTAAATYCTSAGGATCPSSTGVTAGSSTTFTGSNVFTSSVALKGTVGGDNAIAGYVGEYISSTSASAKSFGASDTYMDVSSITLTAGDWDVSGFLAFAANGATITEIIMGISPNSGSSTAGLTPGDNRGDVAIPTSARDSSGVIPAYRINLTVTTNYYLKAFATYTVATPTARGRLSARRVR